MNELDGTVEQEPDGMLLGNNPSPKRVDEANNFASEEILGDEGF